MENLRHHRPGLLLELLPETDNLVQRKGGVFAAYRYIAPVNEHGIPDREALVYGAIEAAHGKLDWGRDYDDHHLAWPKAYYQKISIPTNRTLGMQYRNLRSLRYLGPRQQHEDFHVSFTVPPVPSAEVMVQYIQEEEQLRGLYALLQFTPEERETSVIDARTEIARRARYLAKLEHILPGQLGHLPDTDYLAGLSTTDARREIGTRIRYLTYRDILKSIGSTRLAMGAFACSKFAKPIE